MTTVTVKHAEWQTDLEDIRAIRNNVFVDEQRVPVELEWDGHDEESNHWLALDADNNPLGTVRMLADGHIGRMAVLKDARNQGIGTQLLKAATEFAQQQQLFEIYLYAQTQAIPFYQQQGFEQQGEEFMDAGIPHFTMRKQLVEKRQVGLHGGKFAIKKPELHQAIIELITQTERQLRILSYDLDSDVFDTPSMKDAVSALARHSRFSEIRILVADTSRIVKSGHLLLELQRRLPTSIHIRKLHDPAHHVKDNLVIADNTAVISQSVKEPEICWGNFNNRPIAEDNTALFDDLWNHALEDSDLRRLEI